MRIPYAQITFIAVLCSVFAPAFAAEPLSLAEAVRIAAMREDPSAQLHRERAKAADDKAIASAQLPDPQVRLGMQSVPVDSFSLSQEPMSQMQASVKQRFPAGDTLKLKKKRQTIVASLNRTMEDLQKRKIAYATREAWLEISFLEQARAVTLLARKEVEGLVRISASTYASGKSSAQNVLRSELELDLIDDRLVEYQRKIDMAKSRLARYIGDVHVARPWQGGVAHLPAIKSRDALLDGLSFHPVIQAGERGIAIKDVEIDLAQQQYKPNWGVDMAYGRRQAGRADFVSAGLSFSVPLFTAKRQDRKLSAAKREKNAARLGKDARLMDMSAEVNMTYANWQRLAERITLYQKSVGMRAEQTAIASLDAYSRDVSDFAEMVRARLANLDIDIKLLKLVTDKHMAEARLLFLDGEHHD